MVNTYNFFIQCFPKNKSEATIPDVAGIYLNLSYSRQVQNVEKGKIENTSQCLLISSLSGETRNSVGMARLAEPVRRVSGRA